MKWTALADESPQRKPGVAGLRTAWKATSLSVHIVVPYYVEPRYLIELIASVRAQTSPDWLLTIVDDQYPGTEAEDYIARLGDRRIEYVRNERNLGATANVCHCMTLGRLDYLTVMGADDALEPGYVQVVLDTFERHKNAIMVHPGVTIIDGNGAPTDTLTDRVKRLASRNAWRQRELDGRAALESLMRGNWLYVGAMCYRQDVVPRAKQLGEYKSIADLGWVTDMLLGGGTLALEPTPGYRMRRHASSHSAVLAKTVTRFDEEAAYYQVAARKLEEKGWSKAARAARMHPLSRLHAMHSAIGALSGRDVRLAGALTRRALRPVR
jgi:glycosyltransferase involved in cell wall biosynthesis